MKKMRVIYALEGTSALILANKISHTEVQALLVLKKLSLKNF
jgi:hypothetical protein